MIDITQKSVHVHVCMYMHTCLVLCIIHSFDASEYIILSLYILHGCISNLKTLPHQ